MPTPPALDPDDPEPLYRQLADLIRAQILSGEMPPRRSLPSKRTLSQQYGVSVRTVEHAMKLLIAEGLIRTVHGKGQRVTDPGERPPG